MAFGQFARGKDRKSGNKAVRRQDGQAGIAHPHEHHQHEIRRVGFAAVLALFLEPVAIGVGRFVPVVPIGDKDGQVAEPRADGIDHAHVGHGPQPMHHAEMVGRLERRGPDNGLRQFGIRLAGRVGIEAEDRAEIHFARLGEGQAIGLRPGERLLVRINLSFTELLDPHAGHKSLPDVVPALPVEFLVVNVEGVFVFAEEDSLRLPVSQEGGRPAVTRSGSASPGSSRLRIRRITLHGWRS